jgi:hypothetical protein
MGVELPECVLPDRVLQRVVDPRPDSARSGVEPKERPLPTKPRSAPHRARGTEPVSLRGEQQ